MWSGPIRYVWMKAICPWVTSRFLLLLHRFLQGYRSRCKQAPCCVGAVCRGGIDHQFNFPLQFYKPCQNVIK